MEGVTPPDVPDVNRVPAGIQRLLTPRLACPCATRQKKSDVVIEKFGMGDAGQALKSFVPLPFVGKGLKNLGDMFAFPTRPARATRC